VLDSQIQNFLEISNARQKFNLTNLRSKAVGFGFSKKSRMETEQSSKTNTASRIKENDEIIEIQP
jgi:hypothetical protein